MSNRVVSRSDSYICTPTEDGSVISRAKGVVCNVAKNVQGAVQHLRDASLSKPLPKGHQAALKKSVEEISAQKPPAKSLAERLKLDYFPPAESLGPCLAKHPLLGDFQYFREKGIADAVIQVALDRFAGNPKPDNWKEQIRAETVHLVRSLKATRELPTVTQISSAMNIEQAILQCSE